MTLLPNPGKPGFYGVGLLLPTLNVYVSSVSDCTTQIVSEPERKSPKGFLVTGSKYTEIMS